MISSLIFAAALAVTGPEVHVGTIDGATQDGTLQQISAAKLAIETAQGVVNLPAEQLLSVSVTKKSSDEKAADSQSAWVELVDGSRLSGESLTFQDGLANLIVATEEPVRIPLASIRSVRFSKPEASSAWPAAVTDSPASDVLAVRKKDAIDFMEGTVEGLTAEHVLFRVEGETIPVKRAKVDGFVLAHKASEKLPDAVAVVEDHNGNHIKAKAISYDQGVLRIVTPSGEQLARPIDQIARIDYSSGKICYLSDLEPESAEWTPYLDTGNTPAALAQYYAPRRDEGREHQPIRLGGNAYAKGLSMYSRTTATYRVPAGMKKFRAVAGIDDSVRPGGGVQLEVSCDGKILYEGPITGKQPPVDLDLDIAGAKRLTIVVDFGNDGDTGDYLNLAEARTLK